jgi:nucleoside phosphorylase/pimeloyl-ACP methyl ester carboxylesterase
MQILEQAQFQELPGSSEEALIIHRHTGGDGRQLIVLVHGLGGSRYGSKATWGKIPYFLFEDFPTLDIGLYEYRTLFRRWKVWKSVEVEYEAISFADSLRQSNYSDIFLAGHSLGGLLCMAALRYFYISHQVSELKRICGLFLMATPQTGSQKVPAILSWLSKDFYALRPHGRFVTEVQRTLIDAFNLDETSISPGRILIPTWAVLGNSDFWVDRLSAGLHLSAKRCTHVRGSHTSIVKPVHKSNDAYLFLRKRIMIALEHRGADSAEIVSELDGLSDQILKVHQPVPDLDTATPEVTPRPAGPETPTGEALRSAWHPPEDLARRGPLTALLEADGNLGVGEGHAMKPVVDYLVVIPKDEEFGYVREVVERVTARSLLARTDGPLLYARARLPTVRDEDASAVIMSVGRMGDAPVQATVEEAVRIWPPGAIALVGIAGSFEPDRMKLGDVLVPARVFGYTEEKASVSRKKADVEREKAGVNRRRPRRTYRPTGHQLDCTMWALARAVALNRTSEWRRASREAGLADGKLKERLEKEEPPKLHIENNDNLASGNVVVASRAFADAVRKALGDAGTTTRAVEMEAKGFCEALDRVNPKPPALVVRGISDFADEDKAELEEEFKDGWRRYAAQNAARFLLEVIHRRPETAAGYRPVARPTFPMDPHTESALLCRQANIHARERGMRTLAFTPFMLCADGLPELDLSLEAHRADGSPVPFADVLLRHADPSGGVLLRKQGLPKVEQHFKRTGDPPALELLAGLPEEAVAISVTAKDEFGREIRAQWRSPT